ncbi:hypothetical protein JB92DRAFT_2834935 [Gautieria morchelliformis]|nr:hypothetical protein JB92DRAFT_2834935 [Gautieria morchelliformis]
MTSSKSRYAVRHGDSLRIRVRRVRSTNASAGTTLNTSIASFLMRVLVLVLATRYLCHCTSAFARPPPDRRVACAPGGHYGAVRAVWVPTHGVCTCTRRYLHTRNGRVEEYFRNATVPEGGKVSRWWGGGWRLGGGDGVLESGGATWGASWSAGGVGACAGAGCTAGGRDQTYPLRCGPTVLG